MSFILGSIVGAVLPSLVGGVVNGLFGIYRDSQNRQFSMQSFGIEQQRLEIERLRLSLEKEKENREKIQMNYHESIHKLEENPYFLNNAWPLTMPPECFSTLKKSDNRIVFRVILAQSTDKEYQKYIGNSVKNRLHSVLTEVFAKSEDRPIQFYLDSWKSEFNNINSSIDGLYQIMKMQPTLVIIPIISDNGETLIIRTAFWGFGIDAENPTSIDFLKIPLGKVKRDVSREFAKRWREFKLKFTEKQTSLDVNPIDELNLKHLEIEEQFINKDISISDLERQTKIYSKYCTDDDRMYEDVTSYIVACIESVISFITDVYCYIQYKYPPTMPYVLSSLRHASYLPSVSQQVLPLYNRFLSFIDESDNESLMNIDCYTIKDLTKKIESLIDSSDLRFKNKNIHSKSCATRLIWDKTLSDKLKNCFGHHSRLDDKMKADIVNYVYDLVVNLDNSCKKECVNRFIVSLFEDENKDSIFFSIISRHTIISEFQLFIQLASYRIYLDTEQEGQGVNWLSAYCIAEKIAEKCENKESNKLNFTPAMFLVYEKYDNELTRIIEETLIKFNIIEKKGSTHNKKIISECKNDVVLTENLRKIADLLLSYGHEEEKRSEES